MKDFDINDIQLKIQAPELTLDAEMNESILDNITKLGHLFSRISKCEMMLRTESGRKHIMEADIKIFIPGSMLYATGKSMDLRTAVNEAFHDVHEQLHKYKERLKDHHPEVVTKLTADDVSEISSEEEEA